MEAWKADPAGHQNTRNRSGRLEAASSEEAIAMRFLFATFLSLFFSLYPSSRQIHPVGIFLFFCVLESLWVLFESKSRKTVGLVGGGLLFRCS